MLIKAFININFGLSDLAEIQNLSNVTNPRYTCNVYGNLTLIYC